MPPPRIDPAWLLVRRATGMPDDTIIEATGISRATLQDMRRRCIEMAEMGHMPSGVWSRDQIRQGAVFHIDRYPAAGDRSCCP